MREEEMISKTHSEFYQEISVLKNDFKNIVDKLNSVATKLEAILEAHRATQTKVDGYGYTIARHGLDITELQEAIAPLKDFKIEIKTTIKIWGTIIGFGSGIVSSVLTAIIVTSVIK